MINFLINVSEDPNLMSLYEKNPRKVLQDAGIPEDKWDEIISGDLERIQGVVNGMTAIPIFCFGRPLCPLDAAFAKI